MNLRNKYMVTTMRILFGLLMVFSGAVGLYMGVPSEGLPENLLVINQALWDSGLFHMIKITEFVAGLMLVFNLLPALAAIFLAPIAVGIIVFNAMLMPPFVIAGLIVAAFDGYLGYAYWEKYKSLFKR